MLTKENAAAELDGCEYREEGSKELFARMKEARLVAVFGGSDDLCELRGAIDDELGMDTVLLNRDGLVINTCDDDDCPFFKRLKGAIDIARICPIWDEGEIDGIRYSWRYETTIPHATFKVMEDGEDHYCLGIVFSLDDLGGKPADVGLSLQSTLVACRDKFAAYGREHRTKAEGFRHKALGVSTDSMAYENRIEDAQASDAKAKVNEDMVALIDRVLGGEG